MCKAGISASADAATAPKTARPIRISVAISLIAYRLSRIAYHVVTRHVVTYHDLRIDRHVVAQRRDDLERAVELIDPAGDAHLRAGLHRRRTRHVVKYIAEDHYHHFAAAVVDEHAHAGREAFHAQHVPDDRRQ